MNDIKNSIKKRVAKAISYTIKELNTRGLTLEIYHITTDLKELVIVDSETKEIYFEGSCYEWILICMSFDTKHLVKRLGGDSKNMAHNIYILEPSLLYTKKGV